MQSEILGSGSISSIKNIAAGLNARKIFLVTGKHSFTASGAQAALYRHLAHLTIERFSEFDVNPRLEDVSRGVNLLRSFRPDLVIAVGGGSVIDMGKLVSILSVQPHEDTTSIVEKSIITAKGVPFAAIPTTSGTGSEATHFAVVYVHGQKFSVAHRYMLPDFVIVDAELTYNTGPYQSAVSGMDALCQGVESYWSVHSTKRSRYFASKAIKSILASLKNSVLTGSKVSRRKMALGAHYSGQAINITKTTAPHALSYSLTSNYGIPHGHAVALILGKFFVINEENRESPIDRRGSAYFGQIMDDLYTMFGCKNAAACSDCWYRLMESIGLKTEFASLGIKDARDYDLIINGVNLERLNNHPVPLTHGRLSMLFD